MSDKTNPIMKNDSRRRSLMLSMLGSASVLICVFFFIAFVSFKPDQRSLSDRYFPSLTPTFTTTPTFTPTVTLTPTTTFTATISPTPSLTPTPHLLITPSEDATVVEDRFDSNKLRWFPYYGDNKVTIMDGKMHLSSTQIGYVGLTFCGGCPRFKYPFYFQAEVLPAEKTQIEHGLAFCGSGVTDEYYIFVVNSDAQFYSLSKSTLTGWETLIEQLRAPAKINRYPQSNTLAVQYDHGYIKLYANGNQVNSYVDPNPLSCNKIGIYVNNGVVDILADNVFAYQRNSTPTATVTP